MSHITRVAAICENVHGPAQDMLRDVNYDNFTRTGTVHGVHGKHATLMIVHLACALPHWPKNLTERRSANCSISIDLQVRIGKSKVRVYASPACILLVDDRFYL